MQTIRSFIFYYYYKRNTPFGVNVCFEAGSHSVFLNYPLNCLKKLPRRKKTVTIIFFSPLSYFHLRFSLEIYLNWRFSSFPLLYNTICTCIACARASSIFECIYWRACCFAMLCGLGCQVQIYEMLYPILLSYYAKIIILWFKQWLLSYSFPPKNNRKLRKHWFQNRTHIP